MPAPLVGLRCLSPPTREESDAAFGALTVLKRSTKKVGLRRRASAKNAEKATKPLNSLNPCFLRIHRTTSQPALKIAGTLARPSVTGEALVPTSVKPATQLVGAGDVETNPAVAAAPLVVFEDRGTLVNAANAPREPENAPQGPALVFGAPQHAAHDAAQNGLATSAPQPLAQAGVLPASNVSGGLPPLSRLHEEVAAFAVAAWPTRVS